MNTDLTVFKTETQELANAVAGNTFLPYVSLIGKQSKILDDSKLKKRGFEAGRFCLPHKESDKCALIGGTLDNGYGYFEAYIGPSLNKAMLFKDDKIEKVSYNPSSTDFREIKRIFDSKQELTLGVAANYGIETLFILPIEQIDFNSIADEEYKLELKKSKYLVVTYFWSRHSGKYAPAIRGANKPLARLKIISSLIPSAKPYWSASVFETLTTEIPTDLTENIFQAANNFKQLTSANVVIEDAPLR